MEGLTLVEALKWVATIAAAGVVSDLLSGPVGRLVEHRRETLCALLGHREARYNHPPPADDPRWPRGCVVTAWCLRCKRTLRREDGCDA